MQKKQEKCQSCGHDLTGNYCPNCGERRFNRSDLSLNRVLKHFLVSITNLDFNIFRSLYLLLLKPGFLTLEYLKGKRNTLLNPLQLFLLINLIYFIVQPFTIANSFNNNLDSQISRQIYSPITGKIIENKLKDADVKLIEEYHEDFNNKSENLAKSLVIIIVPFIAVLLQLLFFRSKKYFAEHLVFALHFMAYNLLINFTVITLIMTPIIRLVINLERAVQGLELTMALVLILVSLLYSYAAMRRVYKQNRSITILKSVVVSLGFFPIIFIYRFILFFITYIWMGTF